ncbi:uncharacterized protein Z518_01554 [Rhinocladiella mackenziei CBS 650.93]|uniref:Zn(2)-C6 fungal-type domain-containing protein n=1 Tax=Rhinocladiella mackenziei CBS 650.93 TaxID=1442369 RepID=A0A0D2J448_9EURO|nr:uncharacterized protein Z518_01554 [Rhinocladiella mackenziei CBS 650.93]KIX10471.1 hypothetical protein Z518_01554 [Rhinocladiella mackenziei CBS 650.93]
MYRPVEKRISCKRCQTRKIKCSRTTPCRSCSIAGVQCEFRADDWKRAPISHEYVAALEGRIAALESLLSSIKTSTGHERDSIIDGIDLVDHLPSAANTSRSTSGFNDPAGDRPKGYWNLGENGTPIFHGPGSVYITGLLRSYKSSSRLSPRSPSLEKITSIPGTVVKECVALFFRWQHPYCTIIDRHAFLSEFSSSPRTGEYCSPALLYAVCALGAGMSQDQNIKELAEPFSESAEEAVLAKSFWLSHIATSQALLLCSIFETGRGNVSKAWMYSGMAFRMAQDLGIHEDDQPPFWQGAQSTPFDDLESRRRMSLTYAISDKMLSLFFGRSPMMDECEPHSHTTCPVSSVSSSAKVTGPDELLSFHLWERWVSQQSANNLEDLDVSPVSTLLLTKQAELGSIIKEIQLRVHSANRKSHRGSEFWLEALYNKMNARLWSWHNSLPGEMRWSRWGSNLEEVNPSIATLHMLYHTARISLNRPLICKNRLKASSETSKLTSDAFEICDTSVWTIVGILRRFSTQYTLKNAPLIFVHGAVTAIDVALAMGSCSQKDPEGRPNMKDTILPAIDAALGELSHAWTIANDARNNLQNLLRNLQLEKQTKSEKYTNTSPSYTGFCPDFFDLHITDLGAAVTPGVHCMQQKPATVQAPDSLYLNMLGNNNLSVDYSTVFQYGDDSDSNFWSSLATSEDGTPSSWTGSQDSMSYLYGA